MNPYLIGGVLAAPFVIYFLFRFAELKLIYVPSRKVAGDPAERGLKVEEVWLSSSHDNKIHGWWFPCENARGTIIHCHGNADNMTHRIWFAEELTKLPLNLMMYDYQGYGKSEGKPGLHATRADGLAVYDFVREQHAVLGKDLPIILIGQSLGGATSIELASERDVQGMIIESTFTSIVHMGKRFYPFLLPEMLTTITYDSLDKIPHLHMPKLMAHSTSDKKIPYDMGLKLFEAATEPKQWFDLHGAHGEESFRQTPGYWEAVEKFIMELVNNVAQQGGENPVAADHLG